MVSYTFKCHTCLPHMQDINVILQHLLLVWLLVSTVSSIIHFAAHRLGYTSVGHTILSIAYINYYFTLCIHTHYSILLIIFYNTFTTTLHTFTLKYPSFRAIFIQLHSLFTITTIIIIGSVVYIHSTITRHKFLHALISYYYRCSSSIVHIVLYCCSLPWSLLSLLLLLLYFSLFTYICVLLFLNFPSCVTL